MNTEEEGEVIKRRWAQLTKILTTWLKVLHLNDVQLLSVLPAECQYECLLSRAPVLSFGE